MDHFPSMPSTFGEDWTGHAAPSSDMPWEPTQSPPTPPWRVRASSLPSASSGNMPSVPTDSPSTEPVAADPYAKWQRKPATSDYGSTDMDGREFKGKGNFGFQRPVRDPVHAKDPTSSYFWDQPTADDLAWLDQLSLDYWRSEEPMRSGKNGGRVRHGRSGGKYQPYYAAFYRAKGKGKAMMQRFVQKHGKPPGRGGESQHARTHHV